MRVAIAVFQDDISPRFCCAPDIDVVDWDGRRVTNQLHVELGTMGYPDRLEMLKRLGVSVLLCGAFPCAQKPIADRLGLAIVCGLSGSTCATLERLGEILATLSKPCDPS